MAGADSLQWSQPTHNDIKQMILGEVHISTKKCVAGMKTYVYGKAAATDTSMNIYGSSLFDLQKTWDKLVLAARILAAVEEPETIYCVGQRNYAQRAIIKFAKEVGATAAPGRFTPGQFTNQVTQQFVEPRILLVADPRNDSQAVKESSYVNIPVIAFCGADSPMEYVDVAIPCNNRGKESLGLVYWMLAREVKRIRGEIARELAWEVPVDLFFHKDEEDILNAQKAEEGQAEYGQEQHEEYGYEEYEEFYNADGAAPVVDPNAPVDPNAQFQQGGAANEFAQQWDQTGAPQQEWGAQVDDQQWANQGQVGQAPVQQYQENWDAYQPQAADPQAQYAPQPAYAAAPMQTNFQHNGGLDDWDQN